MDVKKYIALGVSTVLVLTGGLLSIKGGGTDVKAGAGSKESKEIETMKDLRKLYENEVKSATMFTTLKTSSTSGYSMYYDGESATESETVTCEQKISYYVTEDESYTEVEAVLHSQEYSEEEGNKLTNSLSVALTYAIYFNDDGEGAIRIDKYEVGMEYDYSGEDEEEYEDEFEEYKEEYEASQEAIEECLGEWLEYGSIDDDMFMWVFSMVSRENNFQINAFRGEAMFYLAAEYYDDKDVFKKESDEQYKMKASAFEEYFHGIGSLKFDLSMKDSPMCSYMYVGGSEFSNDDDEDDYDDYYGDMFDGASFNSECIMAECVMTNINNTQIKAPKNMDVKEF